MSRPDKCKWCGCSKVSSTTGGSLCFKCLTRYYSDDRQWHISDTCAANCVMQMPDLRQRIEAAKQRLESLNGQHVGQAEIYSVIEILEGKDERV